MGLNMSCSNREQQWRNLTRGCRGRAVNVAPPTRTVTVMYQGFPAVEENQGLPLLGVPEATG